MEKTYEKFLSVMSSTLTIVTVAVSCGSCAKSNGSAIAPLFDFGKVEKNLEEREYEVEVGDAKDASDFFDEIEIYAVESCLVAYKDNRGIIIIEFKSEKTAKYFYDYLYDYSFEISSSKSLIKWYEFLLEEYGDEMYFEERSELEDEIKEYKEYIGEGIIGQKDKFVWVATNERVIEDAKG